MDVSYETIRRWVLKFGLPFAGNLRTSRQLPSGQWHLDEMVVSISGKHHWLWRAVDSEGEILDLLVQSTRDKNDGEQLKQSGVHVQRTLVR